MAENSGKNSGKKGKVENLKPFKRGRSGNPKGRPLGRRDRKTVIWEALRRIAEIEDMTPEQMEEEIQVSGILRARKGSFLHYAEISNGLYGKIMDQVDVTSGGRTLADLIATANAHRRRKEADTATGEV